MCYSAELKMKLQLFAVLLVVAGSYALPQANGVVEPSNARNFVEFYIRRIIEGVIDIIDVAGLDPLEVERRDFDINLESLDIAVKGFVENVRFSGASNIKINQLEYSYLFNRLRLHLSLPEIRLVVGDSSVQAVVAGTTIEGQLKGSLSIKSIRVAGVGYVDVNLIGDIKLRSVSLDCSIGGIESDLSVVVQGSDRSEFVNNLLNDRIPKYLDDNKDEINKRLENVVSEILKRIWNS